VIVQAHTLGKFRLVALLGKGGMSDVFLAATDEQLVDFTKLVVIKKLREEFSQDADFVMMFLDEARIAARLNHPNVIQTLDVGQAGEDYFLAMEYLDGQPVSRILRSTSFGVPLGMHLSIIAEALGGLHYAHDLKDYDGSQLNMVHRDVTPHNIFVTYTGQVKVMDFGIAKAAGRAAETRVGVVKGKVAYMAPEQILLQPVDRRADVYAAGVILYEAATRARMWEGVTQQELLTRLVHGECPRSPKLKRPDVHEELDRICQKALSFDPADRYPTAAALQEDLENFVAEHEKRPSPRQLGAFISERFSSQQEHARRVIQEQLTQLMNSRRSIITIDSDGEESGPGEDSTSAGPPPRSSQDDGNSGPRSQDTPSALLGHDALLTDDTKLSGLPSRSRRLSVLYVVAGIALAVLVGALGYSGTSSRAGASDVAAPSDITLTLRATPLEAHFRVDDGAPLDNPFIARMPRDERLHRIRVEATGFVGETEETRFDQDVSFRFSLAPLKK
jgi:serine/threonine protein kinase